MRKTIEEDDEAGIISSPNLLATAFSDPGRRPFRIFRDLAGRIGHGWRLRNAASTTTRNSASDSRS